MQRSEVVHVHILMPEHRTLLSSELCTFSITNVAILIEVTRPRPMLTRGVLSFEVSESVITVYVVHF